MGCRRGRGRGQDECQNATGGDADQAFAAEEEDVATELQGETVCSHQEQADVLRWKSRGRFYCSFFPCFYLPFSLGSISDLFMQKWHQTVYFSKYQTAVYIKNSQNFFEIYRRSGSKRQT